jgi:tryptophan halogenase
LFREVKKVVIVGGGTSAWFTAAHMIKEVKNIEITLVDKEVGAPVGVGEGTLLYFDKFLKTCGFQTEEWFNDIDATYKAGILFPNWSKPKDLVWHPFFLNWENENSSVYEAWTHHQDTDFHDISAFFNTSVRHLIEPSHLEKYAFHVDASKLVIWLQERIKDDIKIIKSEMVNINRDEQGYIKSIDLKDGQNVEGDLFVDCTGFKQLLQNEPERVNLLGRLFCDTAVAGHVPYENMSLERHPYVISEAVDHGWIWKIPVQTRIGSGLVFNRSITDPEEAKRYFCEHWGNRIKPEDLKVIDWTPYYLKNPWNKNVVAIGLSGGFIEPLESTGLGTIISGIFGLTTRIKAGYYIDQDREIFNSLMCAIYEDCADFINMHYAYHDPDTPFWKWVKDTIQDSDLHKWYKKHLKDGDAMRNDGKQFFFGGANWYCWLIQIASEITPTKTITKEEASEILNEWKNIVHNTTTVTHDEAIKNYMVYLKDKLVH